MGSFEMPSLLPGNKEQQREKRNGTGPEESAHTGARIIIKSDTTIIRITQFHFLQLGKDIMVIGACWRNLPQARSWESHDSTQVLAWCASVLKHFTHQTILYFVSLRWWTFTGH